MLLPHQVDLHIPSPNFQGEGCQLGRLWSASAILFHLVEQLRSLLRHPRPDIPTDQCDDELRWDGDSSLLRFIEQVVRLQEMVVLGTQVYHGSVEFGKRVCGECRYEVVEEHHDLREQWKRARLCAWLDQGYIRQRDGITLAGNMKYFPWFMPSWEDFPNTEPTDDWISVQEIEFPLQYLSLWWSSYKSIKTMAVHRSYVEKPEAKLW
jgi:hypothetical protein